MSTKRPGEQELALLTWLAEHPSITVGEVADQYGAPRDLARSTVLTMMERLRKKGHLGRRRVDGIYHYAPRTAPGAALQHAVRTFVDRTLGGSITPFVAYVAERESLSDDEIEELETLLARLQRERKKKP